MTYFLLTTSNIANNADDKSNNIAYDVAKSLLYGSKITQTPTNPINVAKNRSRPICSFKKQCANNNVNNGMTKFNAITVEIGNLCKAAQYNNIATNKNTARTPCNLQRFEIKQQRKFFLKNAINNKDKLAKKYRKHTICDGT